MIALDTNILLRYFVQDGGQQAVTATQLVEEDLSPSTQGFVSLPVICELVWSLATTYRQEKAVIVQALERLLASPQIAVEGSAIVSRALADPSCGIADAIIHLVGQSAGCTRTVTFDKKFARLAGVALLAG